jgi:hypothetical protein
MTIKNFQLLAMLIAMLFITDFAYSATYQYDNLNRLSKVM